jgi:hypothetical protein
MSGDEKIMWAVIATILLVTLFFFYQLVWGK